MGTWKEDNPETIVAYKRFLDGTMNSQRAIWESDTFQAYLQYMDAAFEMYQGVGTDAKIKTTDKEKLVGIPAWKKEWGARLTGKRDQKHKETYDKLINLMSRDLSLGSANGG